MRYATGRILLHVCYRDCLKNTCSRKVNPNLVLTDCSCFFNLMIINFVVCFVIVAFNHCIITITYEIDFDVPIYILNILFVQIYKTDLRGHYSSICLQLFRNQIGTGHSNSLRGSHTESTSPSSILQFEIILNLCKLCNFP